jgi:biotin carboxylase
MDKILFIGAGLYQLPGIIKAKEMGLAVIAVDGDINAPGFKLADMPLVIDVKDIERCIKIARDHQVDGVMTIASDIAVPTVAAVAEKLKLPGISSEVAEIATNKALMRKRFAEKGLPSPKFRTSTNLQEVRNSIQILGLPVVIKPIDNAGSRGVSKISSIMEIEKAFLHAFENSRKGEVIIEEFMEGIECTIEGMTYEDKTEILAISQKKKPEGHYRVATDLTYPPDFPFEIINEIEKVTKLAISAIGINMGPTHSEVIVTTDGPKLVEVAARGGGFDVFTKVVPIVSGVDTIGETIKMSLGINPDITPKHSRSVVLRFFAPPSGTLKGIEGIDEAKSVKDAEFGFYKEIGDEIIPLATDGDRTGYIITWDKTRRGAVKKADMIEDKIRFVV